RLVAPLARVLLQLRPLVAGGVGDPVAEGLDRLHLLVVLDETGRADSDPGGAVCGGALAAALGRLARALVDVAHDHLRAARRAGLVHDADDGPRPARLDAGALGGDVPAHDLVVGRV